MLVSTLPLLSLFPRLIDCQGKIREIAFIDETCLIIALSPPLPVKFYVECCHRPELFSLRLLAVMRKKSFLLQIYLKQNFSNALPKAYNVRFSQFLTVIWDTFTKRATSF